ncbi:metal-dependent hydrolase family protein [Nitrospirillum pindoramense]|uniref:Imidazolonepropionase-like amidohydrolase n=1 Tax=Nitrospirillum amazonense TaxID=28077 RepID=A0A560GR30_9PROT|nr:amidohydrolase family protein [Nitrospirillum amazonense]TWB36472.1 imidazolonepropionase-like amidohydrolase [Nitrospirillum amazonense]
MPRTIVRCRRLFTGLEDGARADQTLVIEDGLFTQVGPTGDAPAPAATDTVIDAGDHFVMPGLVDAHTHIVFGNARGEEDIDFWGTPEFRALRGLFFAQRVLAAGYTSIVVPGDAGNCSISVRDAINAGLFTGPRIAASSCVIANRHSLNDWFPEHVGTPDYVTGRLCTTRDAQIEEVRRQAKAGVDVIKIAMDGTHFREDGTHIAAFTQEEIGAMVAEAHRLGKKVVTHAYGKEAVLYAARAGVDVINHAFFADDECIEAMLKSGSHVSPTLTFLRNNVEFGQPHEPTAGSGYQGAQRRVIEVAKRTLTRMRQAGVPFMTGSDSGFAVTPYGEWHAREIEILVDWLGFSPAQALRAATSVSSRAMPRGHTLGAIDPGRRADFIFVDGDPLADVAVLQRPGVVTAVHIGGVPVAVEARRYDPYKVTHLSSLKWTDVYTRDRAAELGLWHSEAQ